MVATWKAPWAIYMVAKLIQSVPTAAFTMVEHVNHNIFRHNADIPQVASSDVPEDERASTNVTVNTSARVHYKANTEAGYTITNTGKYCNPRTNNLMSSTSAVDECAAACTAEAGCTHFYACSQHTNCGTCHSGFSLATDVYCNMYELTDDWTLLLSGDLSSSSLGEFS